MTDSNADSAKNILPQYGMKKKSTRQNTGEKEENMAAANAPEPPIETTTELANIKSLLQVIASDMSGLKAGMDAVHTTVENLVARMTEAETRISTLEDQGRASGATMDTAVATITQLQEKITYLEDAGRRNNVRIVGVAEGAEGRDMQGFVQKLLSETLDIEVTREFEIECTHRTANEAAGTDIFWCVS